MDIDKSTFVNSNGEHMTSGLFWETALNDRTMACYTFKEYDMEKNGKTIYSIYSRYMDEADVTEYEFAKKYFVNWFQWEQICKSPLCQPYIERMREELSVKLRSQAIRNIITLSKDEKGFQAAKYIVEKKWELKRGRPSKAEKKKVMKEETRFADEIDKDLENAGITVQ